MGENPLNRSEENPYIKYMDCDIVSTSREKLEKFIRELRRLTTYVKKPYKSLYPSIDLENNIAPNTQIGRIIIDKQVYNNENRYANEKYSRGGEFIENLVCDNIIIFCHRWLHLANFEELLEDIQEYYDANFVKLSAHSYLFQDYIYENGKYITCPFYHVDKNKQIIQPFTTTNKKTIQPFTIYKPRPNIERK